MIQDLLIAWLMWEVFMTFFVSHMADAETGEMLRPPLCVGDYLLYEKMQVMHA